MAPLSWARSKFPLAATHQHAKTHLTKRPPRTIHLLDYALSELGGMVDAGDLKSPARKGVRVRVPQFAYLKVLILLRNPESGEV
ncbi:hypothetical protein AA0481_1011 [Acetobacter orientalis NRIC 0481]|uniref:Uncharacterized protein n=1 Tax=Acetobacter orientalis TaxID=146474 RepID=A0A0D6NHA0_9PROT|nr:hypothetical protein Abor_003_085 [Acetobacter orientalis]GBR16048.1 hypothetical protein AA0481_1011 [Acetobacter orientalis NRIC 0481]